jgi:hypothetical protein
MCQKCIKNVTKLEEKNKNYKNILEKKKKNFEK